MTSHNRRHKKNKHNRASKPVFELSTISRSVAYALALPLVVPQVAGAQTLENTLSPELKARNHRNLNELSDRIRKVVVNQDNGEVDWNALHDEHYKAVEQARQVIKPWEPELQVGLNYWYTDSWGSDRGRRPYVALRTPEIKASSGHTISRLHVRIENPRWPHNTTIETSTDFPVTPNPNVEKRDLTVDMTARAPSTVVRMDDLSAGTAGTLSDASKFSIDWEYKHADKPTQIGVTPGKASAIRSEHKALTENIAPPKVPRSVFTPVAPTVEVPNIPSPEVLAFQTFADCNFCTSVFSSYTPPGQTQAVGLHVVATGENGEGRAPYADPHYHRLHSTWISGSSYEFEGLVFKTNYIDGGSGASPSQYVRSAVRSDTVYLDSYNHPEFVTYTDNNGIEKFQLSRDTMPDAAPRVTNMTPEGKARNRQYFFVGGGRAFEADNNGQVHFPEGSTIHLAGPLSFGITHQDNNRGSAAERARRLSYNAGTITDIEEKDRDFIINMPVDGEGYLQNKAWVRNAAGELEEKLITGTGDNAGKSVLLGPRNPSSVSNWNQYNSNQSFIEYRIKKSEDGYVGYKVGIGRVEEDNNTVANIENRGTIDFRGESSIGILGYTPNSITISSGRPGALRNTKDAKVLLSGADSFGMKWSMRMADSTEGDKPTEPYAKFHNLGEIVLRKNPDGVDRADGSVAMAVAVDPSLRPGRYVSINYGGAKNMGTIKLQDNIQGAMGAYIDVASDFTNEGTIEVSAIAPKDGGAHPDYNVAMYARQVSAANKGDARVYDKANNYQTRVINADTGNITLSGDYAVGMIASGKETGAFGSVQEQHALALNEGAITSPKAHNNIAMLADKEAEVINRGEINFADAKDSFALMVAEGSKGSLLGEGSIEVTGLASLGVLNQGGDVLIDAENGKSPSISVSGTESIAVYSNKGANGEEPTTLIKAGTITAADSSVAIFADQSTITFNSENDGDVHLVAKDRGLLFFEENGGNFAVKGRNKVTAEVSDGGRGFYLKGFKLSDGTSDGFAPALDKLFEGSDDTAKLEITLGDGGTGFILEKPEGLLKLSETKSTSQNTAFDTGKYISFVPPTHDNYELISMYRGNFSIDQNVNLDESDDAYNRITVMASNQTVEEGVTISGSADGQIAMTDANYRETQEVGGVNDVKLVNKGTIALSGSNLLDAATNEVISSTVGMAGDFVTLHNDKTGVIKMSGEDSFAIFANAGSQAINDGHIELAKGSVGIYAASNLDNEAGLGDHNIDVTHNGTITALPGSTNVYGIWTNYEAEANSTAKVLNNGTIDLSAAPSSLGVNLSAGVDYEATTDASISVASGSIAVRSSGENSMNDHGSTITLDGGSVAYQLQNDYTGKTIDLYPHIVLADGSADAIVYNFRGVDLTTADKANLNLGGITQRKPGTNTVGLINLAGGAKYAVNESVTIDNVQNAAFATVEGGSDLAVNEVVSLTGANNIAVVIADDQSVFTMDGQDGLLTVSGENSIGLFVDEKVKDVKLADTYRINADGGDKSGAAVYVKGAGRTLESDAVLNVNNKAVGILVEEFDSITNNGTITADTASYAIQSEGSKAVTNTGELILTGENAVGIFVKDGESLTTTDQSSITSSASAIAIFADNVKSVAQEGQIKLDGEVLAGLYAVEGDTLANTGAITLTSTDSSASKASAIISDNLGTVSNAAALTVTKAQSAIGIDVSKATTVANEGVITISANGAAESVAAAMDLDEVTGTVSNIGALTVSNAAQAAGLLVSDSTQGLQSVSNEGAIKVSANESATSQAVAIGTDGAQDVTNMAAIEVDKANSAAGMQVKNFNTLINSGEFKVSGGVAAGVFADNGQTLENTGKITATGQSQVAAIFANSVTELTNTAQLAVDGGSEGSAYGIAHATGDSLTNQGAISLTAKEGIAIDASDVETVTNTGAITGTLQTNGTGLRLTKVDTASNEAAVTLSGTRLAAIVHEEGQSLTNMADLTLNGQADSVGTAISAIDVATVSNTGAINAEVAHSGIGLRAENANTVTNAANILVKGDDATLIWVQNVAKLDNESTDAFTLDGERGVGIYGQNLAELDNRSDIHVNGKGAIGLLSEVTDASLTSAQWDNNGELKVASGAIGAYLTGEDLGLAASSHQFNQNAALTVADSVDGDPATVGIIADKDYHHVSLNADMTVGKGSVGIFAHNLDTSDQATISADSGAIAIVSHGDVELNSALNLAAGEVDKPTIGLVHQGDNKQLNLQPSSIQMGASSIGYSINGSGNTVNVAAGTATLDHQSIFLHSSDTTSAIVSDMDVLTKPQAAAGLNSLGSNIAYHVAGDLTSTGLIDMSNSWQNIGIASVYASGNGVATNQGTIKVGRSVYGADGWNSPELRISAGMVAGNDDGMRGIVVNEGVIDVEHPYSMAMVAKGFGSEAINRGQINLHEGADNSVAMFASDGATATNYGSITIDAKDAVGMYSDGTAGTTIRNYGTITLTSSATGSRDVHSGDRVVVDRSANAPRYTGAQNLVADTLKVNYENLQVTDINVRPDAWAARTVKVAEINDHINAVELVNQDEIAKRLQASRLNKPATYKAPDMRMYIDTSGQYFTKPIENLHLLEAARPIKLDLVVGTEATVHTNAKAIQVGETILEPFNTAIVDMDSVEEVNVTSDSLTWVAVPGETLNPANTMDSVYLVKVPYTEFVAVGDRSYNFMAGLEDRYGKAEMGSKEKELFNKLNQIQVGGEAHLQGAVDELIGYQYANTNRRLNSTKDLFDREFKMIRDWDTNTKDTGKVKVFGERERFNSNRSGFYSYKKDAVGFMYVHQKETVKLGDAQGMFAGLAVEEYKFKDSGGSKERAVSLQGGYYWDKAFGDNRDEVLSVRVGGEFSNREMKRRFNVLGESYQNEADYNTIGAFADVSYNWNHRINPNLLITPSVGADLGARYIEGFTETGGVLPLKVKGDMYYTVKPKVGFALEHQVELDKGRWVNDLDVTVGYDFGHNINKTRAAVARSAASYYDYRKDTQGAFGVDVLAKTRVEHKHWGVGAFAGAKIGSKQWVAGLEAKIKFW